MIGRIARPLSLVLLAAFLALPLAAQRGAPGPREPSVLARMWERIAAPVIALFTSEDTDGRSIWDPDGLTSQTPEDGENDGRSIWDPNG